MIWIVGILIIVAAIGWLRPFKSDNPLDAAYLNQKIGQLEKELEDERFSVVNLQTDLHNAMLMYDAEKQKNEVVISQKKSSETRLGQITEHLVPFLDGFRHDPKNCHFLGQPIDFVVFDYDQGEIHFVEVKTGNAQESKRQKTIKNIIKNGKVFYEKYTLNDKGLKVKKEENVD